MYAPICAVSDGFQSKFHHLGDLSFECTSVTMFTSDLSLTSSVNNMSVSKSNSVPPPESALLDVSVHCSVVDTFVNNSSDVPPPPQLCLPSFCSGLTFI